jgi:hypothetical protein
MHVSDRPGEPASRYSAPHFQQCRVNAMRNSLALHHKSSNAFCLAVLTVQKNAESRVHFSRMLPAVLIESR